MLTPELERVVKIKNLHKRTYAIAHVTCNICSKLWVRGYAKTTALLFQIEHIDRPSKSDVNKPEQIQVQAYGQVIGRLFVQLRENRGLK